MAAAATDAGQLPYISPSAGIDAVKDAVAAIRCAVAADADGLRAVLSGAEPGHLIGMLATITVASCRLAGLDTARVDLLLPAPELIREPLKFAGLIAAGAAGGFKYLGLDMAAIDALLAESATRITDHLLEQAPPAGAAQGARPEGR